MTDPLDPLLDPDLWTDDIVVTPKVEEAKAPPVPLAPSAPVPSATSTLPRAPAPRAPAPRPPATAAARMAPPPMPAKPKAAPAPPVAGAAPAVARAVPAVAPAVATVAAPVVAQVAAKTAVVARKLAPESAEPAYSAITASPRTDAAPAPATALAPKSTVNLRDGSRDADDVLDLFDESAPRKTPAIPDAPQALRALAFDAPSADRSVPAEARAKASMDRLATSLCAFWLGSECFALDVALVGEVVTVDDVVPVALAPAPVLGLFNLRGTPVALVDLAAVLEIPGSARTEQDSERRPSALVLRPDDILAAVLIDRIEIVLTKGRDVRASAPSAEDQAFVKGFVEVPDRAGLVVTVLDTSAVVQRLDKLKYT